MDVEINIKDKNVESVFEIGFFHKFVLILNASLVSRIILKNIMIVQSCSHKRAVMSVHWWEVAIDANEHMQH